MSDGYFLLSLLDPESQGIGGGSGAYTMDHDAVIGISHGQFDGEKYEEEPYLTSTSSSLSENTLTYSLWNMTSVEDTFYFGMGYLQADGTFKVLGGLYSSTISTNKGWSSITYTVDASQFPGDGTYKVMPISRLKVNTTYHSAWPSNKYLKVVISGGQIASVTMAPEENLSAEWNGAEGPKLSGFDQKVKFTVTNNSDDEFTGNVYMLMRVPSGSLYRVSAGTTGLYLRSGESVNIEKEVYISSSYGGGTFTIYLSKAESSIAAANLLAQGTIELAAPPSADFSGVVMTKNVTFKGGLPLKAIVTIKNGSSEPYPYPVKILIYKGDVVTSGSASGTSTHEYMGYSDTPIAVGETREIEIPIYDFAEDGIYAAKTSIYRTPTSTVSYGAGNSSDWLNFCAVPVGASGWATYASPYKLNYSNVDPSVKFYTGKVSDNNELTLSAKSNIYVAGTGFVVNGTPNSVYAVPVSTAQGYIVTQDLVGVTEDATFAPGSIYVLGKNAADELGFFPYAGTTMAAKHAYLPISKVQASAPSLKIVFEDDDATGISTMQDSESSTQSVYNIAGQKVSTSYKGIVIKNGKQILAK